jgi:hypothetical protein
MRWSALTFGANENTATDPYDPVVHVDVGNPGESASLKPSTVIADPTAVPIDVGPK